MSAALSETWAVLREAYRSFFRHLGPLSAGSIAFFSSLSLVPLFLLLVSVIGHIAGSREAYGELATVLRRYLPGSGEAVLQALRASRTPSGRWVLDLGGALALLWSAMSLFTTISQVLTVVWTGGPRRGYLRRKLVSLLAVLAAGVVFLGTLVLTSVLAALSSYADSFEVISRLQSQLAFLGSALAWVMNVILAAAVFFFLYLLLPGGKVSVKAALVAAALAAALWIISRSAFSLLVAGSSRHGQVYGPLAGAVLLLLWIYCSAYIMIFCAEVGAAVQRRRWLA